MVTHEQAFVGIQVGAISFIDEGVPETLDRFVEQGGVNTICVSALSWSRGNAGRATSAFPDHGAQQPDNLQGGAFFPPDKRYYEATSLKHFSAPDSLYHEFDALGSVIPEARRRGIAVYPYYCETSHPQPRPLWQPGFAQVLEVDAFGRKATRPCLRNPDYRAWWFGVIENWLSAYELDGVMWGIERQGPLAAMLESDVPTCFCTSCRTEANMRNIDAERAAEGYRAMSRYLDQARAGERPGDGYLITFLRLLADYPEIGQWEKLWLDGHKSLYREIAGQVKFFGDGYQVGLGIWQMIDTFNPWLRAQHDPAEYRLYADWLKPVLYNVPAGHRFAAYVRRLCQTILRDASPEEWTPLLYRILGLDEAAFEELPRSGFSPTYVRDQTARYAKLAGPGVPIYPGLGIGVEPGERNVSPQDVDTMVEAAFEGGAKGVMISRNYSELTLENLAAVGKALRRLGKIG
jgi:hypothetical protein